MPSLKRHAILTICIIAVLSLGVGVGVGIFVPRLQPTEVTADQVHAPVFLIDTTTTARVRQVGQEAWSPLISAYGSCSAFFVDDKGRALTAKHCVDPELRKRNILSKYLGFNVADMGEMTAAIMAGYEVEGTEAGTSSDLKITANQPYGPMIGGDYPLHGQHPVVVVDDAPNNDSDQALLQVEGLDGPTPYLRIASKSLSMGDRVYAIGYPAIGSGTPPFVFSPGYVLSNTLPVVGETMLSTPIWFGMSGGPTVNARGEVVGVNKELLIGNPSLAFVTDRFHVADFLEQDDIRQPVATPIYKDPRFIVPLAVVLFLVVTSPLSLLVWASRRSATPVVVAAPEPQPVG